MIKKGCFYSVFAIIFIVGVGYYLWQKYGNEIQREAKERLVELAVKNINEKVAGLNPDIKADSLTSHLENYFNDKIEKLNADEIKSYFDNIREHLDDTFIKDKLKNFNISKLDEILNSYEK